MTYDPNKHHRHAMRLQGYNYSDAGAYFVTIVTLNRCCFFGDIVEGVMRLNKLGEGVEQSWLELARRFPNLELDEFVVMPNHLHGIVVFAQGNRTLLSEVIRTFKALTTYRVRQREVGGFGWQRSFHDRIIRSDAHLKNTREYIVNNPAHWAEDEENPEGAINPRPYMG